MGRLPEKGYLALPLRLTRGALQTCPLGESIERFIQLNLNVPLQGRDRPRWLPADPNIGCRIPHGDFNAVVKALHADAPSLVVSIKDTVGATESRVSALEVDVEDVPGGDPVRRRKDGVHEGPMKRVTLRCRRIDGKEQRIRYDVAFAGPGPVFPGKDLP